MRRTTIGYHDRIRRGEFPEIVVLITTGFGVMAYFKRMLQFTADLDGNYADGSVLADGSEVAGTGLGFLERMPRLLSVGGLAQVIQPKKTGLVTSYGQKQQQQCRITLGNSDRHFSQLLAKNEFLTMSLSVYLCFDDLPFAEGLKYFEGTVDSVELMPADCVLEVVEK